MRQNTAILVVDDDPSINQLLQACLEGEGWKARAVLSGEQALRAVDEDPPDLIILDIMLPGISGIEVCRRISDAYLMPIIMLSARCDVRDKVTCLNAGADDYIAKPFSIDELTARVKAVLRRRRGERTTASPGIFPNAGLEIDFNTEIVKLHGRELYLTRTEYCLLRELALNAGKTLTHRHLLAKVWGYEYYGETEYLHQYIRHLRSKIEPDPKQPRNIITIPGRGYRLQKSS
ncbi:MAG: response regulator transcription factor [Chloroflexi bacterium]|nr:response regulator transcription factor [Chloroflexota bacterium]